MPSWNKWIFEKGSDSRWKVPLETINRGIIITHGGFFLSQTVISEPNQLKLEDSHASNRETNPIEAR
jgi:hypothetical protein